MTKGEQVIFLTLLLMCFGLGVSFYLVGEDIAALQSTADQTVDFLSDLHAERAKP